MGDKAIKSNVRARERAYGKRNEGWREKERRREVERGRGLYVCMYVCSKRGRGREKERERVRIGKEDWKEWGGRGV